MAANNIAKDSVIYVLKVLIIFALGFVATELVKIFFIEAEKIELANKIIFGVCFAGFILLFGRFIDKYKK